MSMHSESKTLEWADRLTAELKRVEAEIMKPSAKRLPAPYIGTANGKTGAVNEGTLSLVTCCEHARRTCGRECYAAWHIDVRLPEARVHHAVNTVLRRLAPFAYYCQFFQAAVLAGAVLLRLNETGDFETPEQLEALYRAARIYSHVKVIGYTRRRELAPLLAGAPANVAVRYSVYRDGLETAPAGVRVAAVSDTRTNCPSQIAAARGGTWTCSDCASHGAGCACARLVQWFKAH